VHLHPAPRGRRSSTFIFKAARAIETWRTCHFRAAAREAFARTEAPCGGAGARPPGSLFASGRWAI